MAELEHAKKWQEIYDEMDGDRRFFALSLVKAIEEIDGLMGENAAKDAVLNGLSSRCKLEVLGWKRASASEERGSRDSLGIAAAPTTGAEQKAGE